MSQELVGACGAVVGSEDYFQRINQGTIVAPFMISSSGYQYYSAVGQLGARCVSVLDEIYSDLQSAGALLSELSPERKSNLHQFISNLDEAANFVSPAFTCASGCRSILEQGGSMMSSSIAGIWGTDIGSTSYMQSKCSPIFQSIFADPLASIVQTIVSDLTTIANQISADLNTGVSQHHYMTDENGDAIQSAIYELERCNISALRSPEVRKLCWYSGIPQDKVLTLQKALNKIPGFDTLTEDGVYGEKTSNVWLNFASNLTHGSFPSLTFIDPLQSSLKHYRYIPKIVGDNSFLQIYHDSVSKPLLRLDRHAINIDGTWTPNVPHLNLSALDNAPQWQKRIAARNNGHLQISEEAYDILKNLDQTTKIVQVGGKILAVSGAVLDAIELGTAISDDLAGADQKLGKTTATAGARIIGSWGGSVAGAKLGAMLGASIGSVVPILGTAVGGIAGGIILGVVGSYAGSWAGETIVDITDIWE